jgi:hypothetical protein
VRVAVRCILTLGWHDHFALLCHNLPLQSHHTTR